MPTIDPTYADVYDKLGLSSKPQETKKNDELGQEAFLKLMTTQLMNQDPSSPMENGNFLAQMASFGTVSGISELNQSFSSFSASIQSNKALQASTMVGRSVLIAATTNTLDADGMKGAVKLTKSTNNLFISISDQSGQLLKQINLGQNQAGFVDYQWDGVLDNGQTVAPGQYVVTAEATFNGEAEAFENLSQVHVDSVTIGQGSEELTLSSSGYDDISLSDVLRIM